MAKAGAWSWEWLSEDACSAIPEYWYRYKGTFKTQRLAEDDMYAWLSRNGHRTARVVHIDDGDGVSSVCIPMRPKVDSLHPQILSWMRRARAAMRSRTAIKFDALSRECDELIGTNDAH